MKSQHGLKCEINSVVELIYTNILIYDDKLFINKVSSTEDCARTEMEHLLKAKGLWGMLIEMDMLAQDANPQAQAEFTKLQEKAFSMLVSNMRTPQL